MLPWSMCQAETIHIFVVVHLIEESADYPMWCMLGKITWSGISWLGLLCKRWYICVPDSGMCPMDLLDNGDIVTVERTAQEVVDLNQDYCS